MKYIIEVLSPNPTGTRTQVYPSRESAEAALDSYNYHRPGQPVIVLYQDGSDTKALLAIGISTKDYTLVSSGDAIQNNYISNISASNIILDSIDITGLLSENGPGCPKENGANYELIGGAHRHFGWLGTTESEDAVVYDPKRGTFSTVQGLTVQQMFDAILNGKTGPGPVTTYTVQVTENDPTHCTVTCVPATYKTGVQHITGVELNITAEVDYDEHYHFVRWTKNDQQYSTEESITITDTVGTTNLIYKAECAIDTYVIEFINNIDGNRKVPRTLQYNASIPFNSVVSQLIDTTQYEVDYWLKADRETRVDNPSAEKAIENTTYYLVPKEKEVLKWSIDNGETWTPGYNTISDLKQYALKDEIKLWDIECLSVTDENPGPTGCVYMPFTFNRDENVDTLYKGITGSNLDFYEYNTFSGRWDKHTEEFENSNNIYKWIPSDLDDPYLSYTTIFAIKTI